MEENIRTRKRIFEKILMLEGTDNKRNWEMLCSSGKSLVPFIGAGISAWCYPTWDSLLKGVVEDFFSKKCADVVSDALSCCEKPDVKNQKDFHWMEEIAECIFEENSSKYNENREKYELVNSESTKMEDINLKKLRDYIGNEGVNKKRAARGALNHRFDDALIKTRKIPEYQRYFPILFPHILVTTNYDNALKACYPSMLSYSHKDLNKEGNRSWLFKAVSEKLNAMNGNAAGLPSVTVPDMPMLLKVHGSIERVDEIALTRSGYEKIYMGEMLELLEKIFEDFRQVDSKRNRSVEGTGLGLAIVRHLVELMGGLIDVDSVYGEGTTVIITIPPKIVDRRSIAELPEIPQTELRYAEAFTAPDVRVLIVDDNLINRKVARGFLKSYAFQLAEAESGPEAIELVRQNRYDIIFMDHMMPMMDGIEAAEIIRKDCGENGAAPAMIALTANAMEGMREKFLDCGFQDFIAKPLDRKELNQLLLRWVPEKYRQTETEGNGAEEQWNPESIRIEGLDMKAAMQFFSGVEEEFLDLLELYRMDGKRKTELLRQLVDSDVQRYQIEVHGLKSASANIGAMDLSAMARAQENAAAKGDSAFIAREFPALLKAYESLLQNIGSFLEQRRRKDDAEAAKLPALTAQELKEQVGTALDQLEHFRSRECADGVEEILRHELPEDMKERLLQIQEQLKLYEDDNAEELLRQLLAIF